MTWEGVVSCKLARPVTERPARASRPLLGPAQQLRRQADQLPPRLLGRLMSGRALNPRHPAAPNAGIEGHGVGVPDLHPDPLSREAQLLSNDLFKDGIGPTPLLELGGVEDHGAVEV